MDQQFELPRNGLRNLDDYLGDFHLDDQPCIWPDFWHR